MSAEGFRARARPEPPSAQILVVVANTLERSWRTDAEKGFLSTAVAQVLVDPKPRAKALQRGPHDDPRFAEERRSRPGARPLGAAREPSGVPEARGQASGEARRRSPGPSPRSPPTQTLPARAPSARLRPASRGARTPNPAPQLPERPFSPVTCAAPSELARGGPGADALALSSEHLAGADSADRDPDRAGRGDSTGERGGGHRRRIGAPYLPNGGLASRAPRSSALRPEPRSARTERLAVRATRPRGCRDAPALRRQGIVKIVQGPARRKGTRSRFRDPASRKRSPARSVRLVGAIRQPARRSRRRTRGELSFLLKRPSIPGTRMARR